MWCHSSARYGLISCTCLSYIACGDGSSVCPFHDAQQAINCACPTLQVTRVYMFGYIRTTIPALEFHIVYFTHTVDAHRSQVITVHTDTEVINSFSGHCTH